MTIHRFHHRAIRIGAALALSLLCTPAAWAACRDAVVLVHGNGARPASFDNTYVELRARGLAANEIFRPDWGSKACVACNDHSGTEEAPVLDAIVDAIARSCTGRIDVIGHSMGVTLAARQIVKHQLAGSVDAFVGIAGAWRGLRSCGSYPFNVPTSTCGYWGLSIGSPLLNSLQSRPLATRIYTIKSNIDQVVCAGGICTVGGVHASRIPGERSSDTYLLGHFGLQTDTAVRQVNLVW